MNTIETIALPILEVRLKQLPSPSLTTSARLLRAPWCCCRGWSFSCFFSCLLPLQLSSPTLVLLHSAAAENSPALQRVRLWVTSLLRLRSS